MFLRVLIVYLVLEFQSNVVFAKLAISDINEPSFWEDLDNDVLRQDSLVLENNHDLERDDISGETGNIVFWITGNK